MAKEIEQQVREKLLPDVTPKLEVVEGDAESESVAA